MKTYVASTLRNGRGIFAGEDIFLGNFIFKVEGTRVRLPYTLENYTIGKHWLGIGHQEWIETSEENPLYFTNHSCNPNAALEDKSRSSQYTLFQKAKRSLLIIVLPKKIPIGKWNAIAGRKSAEK